MGATVGGRRVKTFDTEALVATQERTFPALEYVVYAEAAIERAARHMRQAREALRRENRRAEREATKAVVNHTGE